MGHGSQKMPGALTFPLSTGPVTPSHEPFPKDMGHATESSQRQSWVVHRMRPSTTGGVSLAAGLLGPATRGPRRPLPFAATPFGLRTTKRYRAVLKAPLLALRETEGGPSGWSGGLAIPGQPPAVNCRPPVHPQKSSAVPESEVPESPKTPWKNGENGKAGKMGGKGGGGDEESS